MAGAKRKEMVERRRIRKIGFVAGTDGPGNRLEGRGKEDPREASSSDAALSDGCRNGTREGKEMGAKEGGVGVTGTAKDSYKHYQRTGGGVAR